MAKPRKQTYTMDMYLNKNRDKDIRNDADVQRPYIWSSEQANELIYTVLTEDYIPPVILGEEISSQLWVIDGGQRTSTCMRYRFGNYKITSSIEDSIISYRAKKRDDKGNIVVDGNNNIVWEDVEFDIKNKTYNDLPEELKKRFNEYQIETVIHEDCDMKRISKLIKRYNNHTSMNAVQKAFTYVDNFARDIRGILENDFFKNCGGYTEKEKNKGVLERVMLESVMCMFHLDDWKKQAKRMSSYLNTNSTKEEFDKLESNLKRLEKVLGEEFKDIFTSKNTFIWLTLFDRFTKLNLEDIEFVRFLRAFKTELKDKEVDGKKFSEEDTKRNTKDKTVIVCKLHILETLMGTYFAEKNKLQETSTLELIQECVCENSTEEDVEFYEAMLDDYKVEVDNDSELLEKDNKPSLIAIIGHACEEEKDEILPIWFVKFFKENNTYLKDQKENYLHMKNDFNDFVRKQEMGVA